MQQNKPGIPSEITLFCQSQEMGLPVGSQLLKGGAISRTHRLFTEKEHTLILKQSENAPSDLYLREAEGLHNLSLPSCPRIPQIYLVGESFLLLEDLGELPPPEADLWETFGYAVAALHQHIHSQFGFHHDNYLGLLPQWNGWMEDGHTFFAQNRILRYLSEPLCEQTLTAEDRLALDSICRRLPELIPSQPASLLHGDIWYGNMCCTPQGEPALIDPAVYYGWAEAELSMIRQQGNVPESFFAAYNEVRPLEVGWWERLELLYLREILSMIAHFGNKYGSLEKLREVTTKFA